MHVQHPVVDDTRRRRAGRHFGLGGGGAAGELGVHGVGGALAAPGLGEWNVHGEGNINELEGRRGEVEVVGDFLDGRGRDVVAEEGAQ